MNIPSLPRHLVSAAVGAAISEDLGLAGDVTSASTIPSETRSKAVIAARTAGVIAGVDLALSTFHQIDKSVELDIRHGDGAHVVKGDTVLSMEGPSRSILSAERVALNFLGHLSGIATATAALVKETTGTNAKIVCTRKTTPGLRAFEKYAVRCGGGHNHRFGLYDAVMIKDNHIAAVGGIAKAVEAARAAVGHTVKIEVEIDGLDQLDAALGADADIIMLDNMSTNDIRKAVKQAAGRAVMEASGNITVETVRAIAETGVDIISSGWITHSAPSLDLGMDFQ